MSSRTRIGLPRAGAVSPFTPVCTLHRLGTIARVCAMVAAAALPTGAWAAGCTTAALCGFGACFWISGRLVPEGASLLPRLLTLAVSGALVVGGLVLLFPSCLAGPYQMIDPISRFYWFERLGQEQGLFGFSQIGQATTAVMVLLALLTLAAARRLNRRITNA